MAKIDGKPDQAEDQAKTLAQNATGGIPVSTSIEMYSRPDTKLDTTQGLKSKIRITYIMFHGDESTSNKNIRLWMFALRLTDDPWIRRLLCTDQERGAAARRRKLIIARQ